MPIWFFPALLALSAVTAMASAIWLVIHAQAVATLFRRRGDVVPAPRKARASRGSVWLALALFNLGWMASIAIWTLAMTGEANEVVRQNRLD
jgi:hypothetical protein